MHTRRYQWNTGLVTCLCITLSAACGDGSSGHNNVGQDAAVDAEPDAVVLQSVSVVVKAWSWDDATHIPVSGATVAFDAPGGGRTERFTGADGRVTFDGIDWSAGEAAITAHLADHIIHSHVHLDEARVASLVNEDGDLGIFLSIGTPGSDMVSVRGSATGLADVAHTYTVNVVNTSAVIWRTNESVPGSAGYDLTAPSGEPFVIQAFESDYTKLPSGRGYDRPIYNVMHMDYGPITTDATGVVLDFGAHAMTTHTADVSLLLPPRTDSPLRASDTIPQCGYTNGPLFIEPLGWSTYLDVVDNNNRVDISFLWVEPAWAQSTRWVCHIAGPDGESSSAIVDGAPQSGSQVQLLDPPSWVVPSAPQTPHALHDPLQWQWYDDVDSSRVTVTHAGSHFWHLDMGPNATTLTIPQPPSTVTPQEIHTGYPLQMHISGWSNDTNGRPTRSTRSVSANVIPTP